MKLQASFTLADTIPALLSHILSECDTVDTDAAYDEMLNECYDFASVGGPFKHMQPAKVLENCEPVTYRCGFSDWLDSESDRLVEIDGSHYEREAAEAAKQEFLDALESELSDLEDTAFVESDLEEVRAKIAAVESHSF